MGKKPMTIFQVMESLAAFYGPQNWWPGAHDLEVLTGMILIQNTNFRNVDSALKNLQPYFQLPVLLELPDEKMAELIRPSGYYTVKTKRLKSVLNWYAQYDGDSQKISEKNLPELRQELLAIHGVGEETADVMLLYLFSKPVFVADNYAMRLFSRTGIGEYQKYQKMKADWEPVVSKLDLKTAQEWHALIDVHCQQYCQKKPKCAVCPLFGQCPYPEKQGIA